MPSALLKQSKGLRFFTLRRRGRPLSEIVPAAGLANARELMQSAGLRGPQPPPSGGPLFAFAHSRGLSAGCCPNILKVFATLRVAQFAAAPTQRHSGSFLFRRVIHRCEKLGKRYFIKGAYYRKRSHIREIISCLHIRDVQPCSLFQFFLRMTMNTTKFFDSQHYFLQ